MMCTCMCDGRSTVPSTCIPEMVSAASAASMSTKLASVMFCNDWPVADTKIGLVRVEPPRMGDAMVELASVLVMWGRTWLPVVTMVMIGLPVPDVLMN